MVDLHPRPGSIRPGRRGADGIPGRRRLPRPHAPVRAAAVFDTMLAAGEIPPTIGVFIMPGAKEGVPQQRSIEYDSVTLRALHHRGRLAVRRGRDRLQADHRPQAADDLRHHQRRHLRLHRRMATCRHVRPGAEPLRFVHGHPRRPQLPVPDPLHRPQADPGVAAERRAPTPTSSSATGPWRTRRSPRRSRTRATTTFVFGEGGHSLRPWRRGVRRRAAVVVARGIDKENQPRRSQRYAELARFSPRIAAISVV